MYEAFKRVMLRLLRVPADPEPPAGAEGSLQVFRAAPRYLHYRVARWLLAQPWVVLSTVAGVMAFQHFVVEHSQGIVTLCLIGLEVLGVATVLGQLLVTLALLRMDYELRWYMVTDRSIRIREGVWQVKEMTLTLANVQNLSVSRGPLQSMLGIADVRVVTAGGGGNTPADKQKQGQVISMHTGFFRGVDNAEEIRDLVRNRLRRHRDSGLGDPDERTRRTRGGDEGVSAAAEEAARQLREEAAALRLAAEEISPT